VRVILFGASGMIGQGVLREALLAPDVEKILAVGRHPIDQRHDKLEQLVHRDFTDFSTVEEQLTGYDACFFCLGVSSAGMSEADYRRVTYDFALAAAGTLVRRNPHMTFVYVSGAGTDSTARGRVMWARVKGETENTLLTLPFKAAYMFRPAFVQPMHGETSRVPLYRRLYAASRWLYPSIRRLFPRYVTTTEHIGRAMLHVVREGPPRRLLESEDIAAIAHMPDRMVR
jgi:uncharacterized protein YbjT (DUF2867 family)